MIALSELPRQDVRPAHETLSARWAETLRGRLLAEIGEWRTRFAHNAAMLETLTADSSEGPTGLDRARVALNMYRSIEAIEEIHDAVARITDGCFGTCQSCGQPIPLERLEMLPQTRFCSVCPVAAGPEQDAPAP